MIQLVEDAQYVEFERRPAILMPTDLALACRLDTSAHVGPAVNVHQAVRTIARQTKQATWSMVLEAACEDAHAGRIQGGRDALSGSSRDALTFIREEDRPLRRRFVVV